MKKILLLGGSRYLRPVIKKAHELGIYAITCDYLPNNYAHKYSDEYVNVSIIEKDKVLYVAEELCVDGIMSFACDPGVVTAAYVAEKMGLPNCGPYSYVELLQNKGEFRKFLSQNGFNVPKSQSYKSGDLPGTEIDIFNWPVIVKPVDSAGSKGVTKVTLKSELKGAIEHALRFSVSGSYIIEEFIEKDGFSSDSDAFSIDGNLAFCSFNDQYFDTSAEGPFVPAGFMWPSSMPKASQEYLQNELNRLIKLLGMKNSLYNIETRRGTDGREYIMEVSPRGGGNRLSECLKYVYGVDLVEKSILAAIGENVGVINPAPVDGIWCEIILHSNKEGSFGGIKFNKDFAKYIVEEDVWINKGDKLEKFGAANNSLGTAILRFDDYEQAKYYMTHEQYMIE